VNADDLDPRAKRLIAAARVGRTPSEADKRRVGAAIATMHVAGTAATGTATGAAAAKVIGGGLAGLRALAAVLLVASTGAGVAWWVSGHSAAPSAPPAIVTPAAPSSSSPVVVPLPPPVEADDPLLAEVTLLRRAQRALSDGQPGKALELATRHAALYPKSQVGVERDGLRVFALCALGRKPEARAIATALLERAPRSPLRASIAESCAMK
jgi:hypothetical protein